MDLINIKNEKIPKSFFVFVNLNNNLTKINFDNTNCISSSAFLQFINEFDISIPNTHLKNVISAYSNMNGLTQDFAQKYLDGSIDYLPFVLNADCNINFISFFNKNITSEYSVEYSAEITRRRFFPKFPSRLSCCYAFSNYQSCIDVSRKYGWNIDSVREFELIEHEHNRVARVNMETVSLARYAEDISSLDEQTQFQIWNHYWNGGGNLPMELPSLNNERRIVESGILWEYLIEGILKIK